MADRQRYGAAMSEQAEMFSSILVKAAHIEDKAAVMEKRLADFSDSARPVLAGGKRRVNADIEATRKNHQRLQRILTQLYKSGVLSQGTVMSGQLNSDFGRFQTSAREMENSYKTYYASYFETIKELKKNIARLRIETRATVARYQTMLKEIRDFISMPVDLDFDPGPDIENLNKKIRDAENLLKKLSVLDKELNVLKKEKTPAARED